MPGYPRGNPGVIPGTLPPRPASRNDFAMSSGFTLISSMPWGSCCDDLEITSGTHMPRITSGNILILTCVNIKEVAWTNANKKYPGITPGLRRNSGCSSQMLCRICRSSMAVWRFTFLSSIAFHPFGLQQVSLYALQRYGS